MLSHADTKVLIAARIVRMFAYGFASVVLALFLAELGLSEEEIGLLFTFTLLGDAGISLWITTRADNVGRRGMLLLGALLMLGAGVVFAVTDNRALLLLAAIIGVISPGGKEIGPFLSIEQAALTQLSPDIKRTHLFAWYNLFGSLAAAFGALAGGFIAHALQQNGLPAVDAYRWLILGYALSGGLLGLLFLRLSPAIEVPARLDQIPMKRTFGLHQSKGVVVKMSLLFGMDAFAGGFIVQSMIAYWFYLKFGVGADVLGEIFFGANLIAAISALAAARIAKRCGLVNTMVFTHIPSSILLILVPLMPTLPLAIAMLLLRFTISQMDVPTRQSYTMAVVSPDERSAASGVTTIARSVGASLSPTLTGMFLANHALMSAPFFVAGGLKIIYDLLLYRSFKKVIPPEEGGE